MQNELANMLEIKSILSSNSVLFDNQSLIFHLTLLMTLELVKSHIKICVLDWITLDYLTPCRRQKTYWYCD